MILQRGITSTSPRLDGPEMASTAAAAAVSASLYARKGHAYLAPGVLGDLLGFALLAGPLAVRRRRLRHEAATCLAAIGIVLAARPRWPPRRSSLFWWTSFTAGFAGYLCLRGSRLAPQAEPPVCRQR